MNSFRGYRASRSAQRGVALPFIALLLIVLLGMTALAIDLGILLGVRTEAQRTADAAALAGASVLLLDGQDEDGARDAAVEFAARNRVGGQILTLDRDADVTVDLTRGYVGVRAQRTAENGNPVQTRFARVIGFPTSNVSAWGAAVAGAGNAVRCPLPFVLADRFWSVSDNRLARWNESYQPGDIYNPGARDDLPPPPTGRTGWSSLDTGQIWRIYPGSTRDTPVPGYYYILDLLDQNASQNLVNQWIGGCPQPDLQFTLGQTLPINNGRRVQPIQNAFGNVAASDEAEWDLTRNCPVLPSDRNRCLGEGDSNRIRPMLVTAPTEAALTTQSGRQDITITNFVGVFIVCEGRITVPPEQVVRRSQCSSSQGGGQGQQNPDDTGIWVRFMGVRGEMGAGTDPSNTTLTRVLRLVE